MLKLLSLACVVFVVHQLNFAAVDAQAAASSSTSRTAVTGQDAGKGSAGTNFAGTNAGTSIVMSSNGQGNSASSTAGQTAQNGKSTSQGSSTDGASVGQLVSQGLGNANGVYGASGNINGAAMVGAQADGSEQLQATQQGDGFGIIFYPNGTVANPNAKTAGSAAGQNSANSVGTGTGTGQASALGPSILTGGSTHGNGLSAANGNSNNGGTSSSSSANQGGINYPAFPGLPQVSINLPMPYGSSHGYGKAGGSSMALGNGLGQSGGQMTGATNGTQQISGVSNAGGGPGQAMASVNGAGYGWLFRK